MEPSNNQTPEATTQEPVAQAPKKVGGGQHAGRRWLYIGLVVLLLLAVGAGIYLWQHGKVSDLNSRLSTSKSSEAAAKKQLSGVQQTNKNLTKQLATLQKKQSSSSPTTTGTGIVDASNDVAHNDENFVAISPSGGYGTPPGTITFAWTPHKDATFYVLEIKHYGQATYPATADESQYVRFKAGEAQPSSIELKYDLNPSTFTNYVWRISARTMINGKETVLQTTPDFNLSIMVP